MMINRPDELRELKDKLYSKGIISFTDEDAYRWKETLTGLINPLLKRYRVFKFCINTKLILIFISLIIFNIAVILLLDLFGFEPGSSMRRIISIVYTGLFWGSIIMLILYIEEYTEFISELQNRELKRVREELSYLLRYQIDLLDEGIKRNIFRDKKSIDKELNYYQKLKKKIDEERIDILLQ